MRGSKKTHFIPLYRVLTEAVDAGLTTDQLADAIRQYTETVLGAEQGVQRMFTRCASHRRSSRPSSPDLYEPWNEEVTRGPADLIRHFVHAAVTEFNPDQAALNDDAREAIYDAVTFATDLALRLAGVPETWLDEYRSQTAHLLK